MNVYWFHTIYFTGNDVFQAGSDGGTPGMGINGFVLPCWPAQIAILEKLLPLTGTSNRLLPKCEFGLEFGTQYARG